MKDINYSISETLQAASFSFPRWRENFLQKILNGAAIFGFVCAILASIDIYKNGSGIQRLIMPAIYASAWVILVIILLIHRPYWLRAGTFIFIFYTLGVSTLLETGMRGLGCLFFLVFIILAAMLFSPRAGIGGVLLSLLTIGAVGIALFTGRINLISRLVMVGRLDLWIVSSLALLLTQVVIITGLTLFSNNKNNKDKNSRIYD